MQTLKRLATISFLSALAAVGLISVAASESRADGFALGSGAWNVQVGSKELPVGAYAATVERNVGKRTALFTDVGVQIDRGPDTTVGHDLKVSILSGSGVAYTIKGDTKLTTSVGLKTLENNTSDLYVTAGVSCAF